MFSAAFRARSMFPCVLQAESRVFHTTTSGSNFISLMSLTASSKCPARASKSTTRAMFFFSVQARVHFGWMIKPSSTYPTWLQAVRTPTKVTWFWLQPELFISLIMWELLLQIQTVHIQLTKCSTKLYFCCTLNKISFSFSPMTQTLHTYQWVFLS